MAHTILIGLHAAFGGISLLAGLVALWRAALSQVHLWALAATIAFLALAVALEWSQLDPTSRVLFAALIALGGFMIWRAAQAVGVRPAGAEPSHAYVRHIGFNLVALFDAFVIVAVLDLGAPVWLVAGAGVVVAVAGHFVRQVTERRLVPSGDRASAVATSRN